MKSISRLCVACLFSTMLSVFAHAESIGFPKDKPAFTIEVPAGWKADYNPSPNSVFVADAELKNSFMAIAMPEGTIISDKDAAAATLKKYVPATDVDVATKELTIMQKYIKPDGFDGPLGEVTLERVQKVIALLEQSKAMPVGSVKPDDVVTMSLAPKS